MFMENFVTEISNLIEEKQKANNHTKDNFEKVEQKLREAEEKIRILNEKEAVPQTLINQIKEEIRFDIQSEVMNSSRRSHRRRTVGKKSIAGTDQSNITPRSNESPYGRAQTNSESESSELDDSQLAHVMKKLKETQSKMTSKLDKTVENLNEKNKIFEAKIKKQIKDNIEKVNKGLTKNTENTAKLQKGVVGLN